MSMMYSTGMYGHLMMIMMIKMMMIMTVMMMMIPIVVTPVGIVTAVSAVQYWKVLPPNNYDIVMVIGVTYFL